MHPPGRTVYPERAISTRRSARRADGVPGHHSRFTRQPPECGDVLRKMLSCQLVAPPILPISALHPLVERLLDASHLRLDGLYQVHVVR